MKLCRILKESSLKLTTELRDNQESYKRIFNISASTKIIQLSDIVDAVFIFQFFYFGTRRAVEAYRRIFRMYTQAISRQAQTMAFVEVSQIIFQRPRMFGPLSEVTRGKGKKQLNKALENYVKFFIQQFLTGDRQFADDEEVRFVLRGGLNDTTVVGKDELKKVIQFAITSTERHNEFDMSATDVGRFLTQKILSW